MRIETGKGVGGELTDLQSNDIIRVTIAPLLREGRYRDAVDQGTRAIADALGKIKSTSSLWIGQTHPELSGFHWQAGYGVFSVSQSNVEAVRAYIRNQPDHHRKQSFQDELCEWLRRYEIEWDERYVWD